MTQNVNDDSSSLRQQRDKYLEKFNKDRSKKYSQEIDKRNLNQASGPNLIPQPDSSPVQFISNLEFDEEKPTNRPISPKQERQNSSVRRESAHLRS